MYRDVFHGNASKGISHILPQSASLTFASCVWTVSNAVRLLQLSGVRHQAASSTHELLAWLSEHTLTLIWCYRNIAGYRTWHNKTTEFELLCTRPCSHQMSRIDRDSDCAWFSRSLLPLCCSSPRTFYHATTSCRIRSGLKCKKHPAVAKLSSLFGHVRAYKTGVGVCEVSEFQHNSDWLGSAWCTCELSCGHLWRDPMRPVDPVARKRRQPSHTASSGWAALVPTSSGMRFMKRWGIHLTHSTAVYIAYAWFELEWVSYDIISLESLEQSLGQSIWHRCHATPHFHPCTVLASGGLGMARSLWRRESTGPSAAQRMKLLGVCWHTWLVMRPCAKTIKNQRTTYHYVHS